ncbi:MULTISPECIES: glycoside hydrolase family 3 N-terminal domain-containing protein [unclassified Actinomyces]|uniref:glycoside hydrolase family 3 N-terminal domain-containing protein n=1 Tax=unclassified Actinomyces TaxID=2609248 RepID=UPI0020181585|nr:MULTISPECIES: glycoside hydrolase family 3 N-terminal domain-containing protein [unclassified Actinomyces]
MLQLIINTLTPVLGSMGVSSADVETYVHNCAGHIYAILAIILVAVVAAIAAHWAARKGDRHVWRWGSGLAAVLGMLLVANLALLGPLNSIVSILMRSKVSVSEQSIAASHEIISRIGDEGFVLAENDDALLPLGPEVTNVNVFGWASTAPIYGGTGSGAADMSNATGVYESLREAGYQTNHTLEQIYRDYRDSRATKETISIGFTDWTLPEPTAEAYTEQVMAEAQAFSDVALVVISRSGGEGQDLPTDMKAVIDGEYATMADTLANGNERFTYYDAAYTNNGDYDDFTEGQHYLELSQTEKDMLAVVDSHFDNVVVLVNSNNTMELGWLDDYPSIKSVLLAPGTGVNGMGALGRILNGQVNPSGHTADTFVTDLTATPAYNNYGGFQYTNVEDMAEEYLAADPAFQGVFGRVSYNEGIYVGYRYYETAYDDAVPGFDYDAEVRYPFGHGLSYTEFSHEITSFDASGEDVTLSVTVTNTGSVAGKDAVEIYSTPPYTNGGIEKASVNLAAFAKTRLLEPGASQEVQLTIPKEDLASYDSSGIKTDDGGYVLEAGEYVISARASSHEVLDSESFTVEADIDYSQSGRDSDGAAATNRFEDYSAGDVTYLSRADQFANYAEATAPPSAEDLIMSDQVRAAIDEYSVAHYDPTAHEDPNAVMPTTGADNGLALRDMTGLDYDDEQWRLLLDQLTVEEMAELVAVGGFQTVAVDSIDKRLMLDSDGPAGLNDWVIGVMGTPYPAEVLVAQTWSTELAGEVGSGIGQEYQDVHIYGWYGPAMNMHRTAFGGRNFEYYSEDGVLAGHLAVATVNGAASHGVYSYIKHFAMNDQEINRCSLLQTYANEQTIREIYLKPFEVVVKGYDEGAPQAVMSAFNYIGTRYTGADPNLLNGVLREEWGFQGMVLTDWYGSYGYQQTTDSVLNGNDLMLGMGSQARSTVENQDSATVVSALRTASHNILFTVANSGNFTVETDGGGPEPLTVRLIIVDLVVGVLCVGIMTLVVLRWRRKKAARAAVLTTSGKDTAGSERADSGQE